MNYRLLSLAEEDLEQAARYYESCAEGLGFEFLDEFEHVMARVRQFPEGWRQISLRHRRCLFRRFPFAALYTVEADSIVVSGVMDLRMAPTRQKQRIEET